MQLIKYICGGSKFAYSKGYIGLPVIIDNLPMKVEVSGTVLKRKSSFHISLVCVKDILAKKPDAEQVVLSEFCKFTSENDISFLGYTGEFRLAEYGERKSIVALCTVSNLNIFLELLSVKIGINIPAQPTHITLFTLQQEIGVGLNTPADMETKSRIVELPPEIRKALNI
jgi:hypothetical protein